LRNLQQNGLVQLQTQARRNPQLARPNGNANWSFNCEDQFDSRAYVWPVILRLIEQNDRCSDTWPKMFSIPVSVCRLALT
jgi:hypothetical protein